MSQEVILSVEDFERVRSERRREVLAIKRARRIAVGPDITFYFENKKTILWQIQEMLRIELKAQSGGDALYWEEAMQSEWNAYKPLLPRIVGQNFILSATMMIEIEDLERRQIVLRQWEGIDACIALKMGGNVMQAFPDNDVERTTEGGKTSSVHFLHFPFSKDTIKNFLSPESKPCLEISHPYYHHSSFLSSSMHRALISDLESIK